MLKERQAVAIPVQEHGQIVIDICLCEIVRKLLEIQYRLRNLKTVRVDGTVSKDEVNLSFVENEQEGSVYRFIDLEGPAEIADIKMKDYN